MHFFGHKLIGPTLVYIFSLGYLSAAHIYRQYRDYNGLETSDFTAPLMILAIKLSSLAFNVYDGHRFKGRVFTDEDRRRGSISFELSEYALKRMPSITEYLGYCFFFGGFLTGPAFDFREYYLCINMCDMHLKTPAEQKEIRERVAKVCKYDSNYERVPSSITPSLKDLLFGLLFSFGVILGGKFPVTYVGTDEFLNNTSFCTESCIQ